MGCTFYLGTPEVSWLRRDETVGVPLFISARRLRRQKKWPRARCPWALDSGGFTELNLFGKWDTPPEVYVQLVQTWSDTIGNLAWAATQDWMCEPSVTARTGRDVREHQRSTVASYLQLHRMAPEIPWAPALQGWDVADYVRCIDMYRAEGIDLAKLPIVGVGTVCRRQGMAVATQIFQAIADHGIRMHGFGLKLTGLRANAHLLTSADSLAWSFHARQQYRAGLRSGVPFAGCGQQHPGSCANCIHFALQWRARVLGIPGVRSAASPTTSTPTASS